MRDHDEETPRDPHRGEALQLQGLWQAVHTKGEPTGKSEMSFKTGQICSIYFFRFMREHTGMTGHSSATFATKNSTEKSQCKSINGVNTALSTSKPDLPPTTTAMSLSPLLLLPLLPTPMSYLMSQVLAILIINNPFFLLPLVL